MSLGCDIHGGRNLCMYFCYDCDVPACCVCLLHEHGPGLIASPPSHGSASGSGGKSTGGHRTAKLRDALAARRDALKTVLNVFGPRLDRLESKARRLSGTMSGMRSSRTSTAVKLDDQSASTSSRPAASTPAASTNNEGAPLLRQPPKQVRLSAHRI